MDNIKIPASFSERLNERRGLADSLRLLSSACDCGEGVTGLQFNDAIDALEAERDNLNDLVTELKWQKRQQDSTPPS